MQVSKDLRKRISQEMHYCADKMSKERDFRKKLFFYSKVSDSVSAAIDLECDSQLVLVELVLDVSYGAIEYRMDLILNEKDTSVELVDGLFDKLSNYLIELALKIENNQDTYEALEKIAGLAHITTDRGYYLYIRGLAKV